MIHEYTCLVKANEMFDWAYKNWPTEFLDWPIMNSVKAALLL